jgi:hypothetical protein
MESLPGSHLIWTERILLGTHCEYHHRQFPAVPDVISRTGVCDGRTCCFEEAFSIVADMKRLLNSQRVAVFGKSFSTQANATQ